MLRNIHSYCSFNFILAALKEIALKEIVKIKLK